MTFVPELSIREALDICAIKPLNGGYSELRHTVNFIQCTGFQNFSTNKIIENISLKTSYIDHIMNHNFIYIGKYHVIEINFISFFINLSVATRTFKIIYAAHISLVVLV